MNNSHFNISAIKVQDFITGFYIVSDIRFTTGRNDNTYMTAILSDATGSIDMVCWDSHKCMSTDLNGSIVFLTGSVHLFRGKLQLCASTIVPAENSSDPRKLEYLVPRAPIDVEQYKQYVLDTVESITDPGLRDICDYIFTCHWERFTVIPAGMGVHHSFAHGLLMHTVNMAVMADEYAAHNPEAINRDLLLAGVLLHDIGKISAFVLSPITGLVTGYTDEGNLIGHAALGAFEIIRAADFFAMEEKVVLPLLHMVLSHHGEVSSMTLEAEILRSLDSMDSCCDVYSRALLNTPPESFSSYVSSLGKRVYRHGIGTGYDSACCGEDACESYDDDRYDEQPDPNLHRGTLVFADGTRVNGFYDEGMFYSEDPEYMEF